jgi:hypothetical protein
MTPKMGPFSVEDSLGMLAALAVVDRSQNKTTGKYKEFV